MCHVFLFVAFNSSWVEGVPCYGMPVESGLPPSGFSFGSQLWLIQANVPRKCPLSAPGAFTAGGGGCPCTPPPIFPFLGWGSKGCSTHPGGVSSSLKKKPGLNNAGFEKVDTNWLGLSSPGCGKTLAFLIPAVNNLLKEPVKGICAKQISSCSK